MTNTIHCHGCGTDMGMTPSLETAEKLQAVGHGLNAAGEFRCICCLTHGDGERVREVQGRGDMYRIRRLHAQAPWHFCSCRSFHFSPDSDEQGNAIAKTCKHLKAANAPVMEPVAVPVAPVAANTVHLPLAYTEALRRWQEPHDPRESGERRQAVIDAKWGRPMSGTRSS